MVPATVQIPALGCLRIPSWLKMARNRYALGIRPIEDRGDRAAVVTPAEKCSPEPSLKSQKSKKGGKENDGPVLKYPASFAPS